MRFTYVEETVPHFEVDMNNAAEIRFMVDHMLIKLGKYLRVIGCDATWDMDLRTHELILRANLENRVFLTRNTRLPYQYPSAARILLIGSSDPVEQFYEVVRYAGLDVNTFLFSKCIKCNLHLENVQDKREIETRVHPNVYARFDDFYRCPCCGTVFWKGSHVRNTCAKLQLPNMSNVKET